MCRGVTGDEAIDISTRVFTHIPLIPAPISLDKTFFKIQIEGREIRKERATIQPQILLYMYTVGLSSIMCV